MYVYGCVPCECGLGGYAHKCFDALKLGAASLDPWARLDSDTSGVCFILRNFVVSVRGRI